MKMLLPTLLFATLAASMREESPYHLDPLASFDGAAMTCKGVTDLPDGAVLNVSILYAGKREIEIDYLKVAVKEGNFVASFALPGDPPFPGAYLLRITFDPAFQYQEIRAKTAGVTATLSWETRCPLGAPGDADAAVEKFKAAIVEDLGAYRTILDEIDRQFETAIKNPKNRAAWETARRSWEGKTRAIVGRHVGRKEYLLAGIGDPVDRAIDGFAHLIDRYADECNRLLTLPTGKPADRSILAKLRARHDYSERLFRHALGILTGGEREIGESLATLRRLYSALDVWYKGRSSSTVEEQRAQWAQWKEEWLSPIGESLQRLAEIVDPNRVGGVMEISTTVNGVMDAIDRLVAGEESPAEVEKGLTELSRKIEELGKRLGVGQNDGR